MKAAKDGQDNQECDYVFPACVSPRSPDDSVPMMTTFNEINKLVQARHAKQVEKSSTDVGVTAVDTVGNSEPIAKPESNTDPESIVMSESVTRPESNTKRESASMSEPETTSESNTELESTKSKLVDIKTTSTPAHKLRYNVLMDFSCFLGEEIQLFQL